MGEVRSANNVDKRLGQRVRTRRLEIGMSQERLAELLGITFQQVQKYEKGVNRIAASRLFEMTAALDMSIERFFEGISKSKTSDHGGDTYAALATADGAELMRMFASIKNLKVRRRVVELARAMTSEG